MPGIQHESKSTVAIGIGCKKGCSSEAVVALVERAIAAASCAGAPAALFTHEAKKSETGLASAAKALGLPLVFLEGQVLRQASLRAATNSPRVMAMFGLPSIAEAAALPARGRRPSCSSRASAMGAQAARSPALEYALQYLHDQTEAAALAAAKKDGDAI